MVPRKSLLHSVQFRRVTAGRRALTVQSVKAVASHPILLAWVRMLAASVPARIIQGLASLPLKVVVSSRAFVTNAG